MKTTPIASALSLVMSALVCLPSCGYTDAGEGTQALEVIATIHHTANTNATHFIVRVQRDNQPVVDAKVFLKDGKSDQELRIPPGDEDGVYETTETLHGYRRRLALAVEHGSDYLTAKLEGPSRHEITDPHHATVVSRSDHKNLKVKWKTRDGIRADRVWLETSEAQYKALSKKDTGSYEIPMSWLKTGAELLRVTRQNAVELAGGTGQSRMEIAFEYHNDVIIKD